MSTLYKLKTISADQFIPPGTIPTGVVASAASITGWVVRNLAGDFPIASGDYVVYQSSLVGGSKRVAQAEFEDIYEPA